jgi:sialidase-1
MNRLCLNLACLTLALSASAQEDVRRTDVFQRGTEGYHTFRIPAVVLSSKQTLLAFIEGRRNSGKDHGDIDLVLRRSTDGGETWGPLQLVYEEGGQEEITIGNPCPIVDRDTGAIWLAFTRNNKQVLMTRSSDDGQTWAAPEELPVTAENWYWVATGPGHGLQLSTGRLLIPTDCETRPAQGVPSRKHSFAIYSDDHGATWQRGQLTGVGMNECQAAERADGSVILSMRNYLGQGKRAFAISRDGGQTWSPPQLHDQVPCPVCEGSIIRHPSGKDRLLHSNPALPKRLDLTIRLSDDGGATWPVAKVLQPGHAEYSDLVVFPNGDIGCLYERSGYKFITFARFSIDWVLNQAPAAR